MHTSYGLDAATWEARQRVLAGIPNDWRAATTDAITDERFGLLADRLVEQWSRPDKVIYPPERQVNARPIPFFVS